MAERLPAVISKIITGPSSNPDYRKYTNTILNWCIAIVWLINGLFCKVLHFVPRHELIVGRIPGDGHAVINSSQEHYRIQSGARYDFVWQVENTCHRLRCKKGLRLRPISI
jgi:hypothetical protein